MGVIFGTHLPRWRKDVGEYTPKMNAIIRELQVNLTKVPYLQFQQIKIHH